MDSLDRRRKRTKAEQQEKRQQANSRASRQTGNRPAAGKLALDSFFPDSHGAGRITCFRMLGSIQTRDPCEGVSKSLEGAPTLRSGDAPQWRGVREREPGWGCTVHTIQTQTWLSLASFFVGTRRWRPARVPSSGRATFGADTVTIGFVAASAVHTTPRRNQQDCPTLGMIERRPCTLELSSFLIQAFETAADRSHHWPTTSKAWTLRGPPAARWPRHNPHHSPPWYTL